MPPVPVSVTTNGDAGSLDVSSRFAVLAPSLVGVKVIVMAHVAAGASV